MKRGLKVCNIYAMNSHELRYNRYPDEKGTERFSEICRASIARSYNRYPDEKGTESNPNPPSPPCQGGSYNYYPD